MSGIPDARDGLTRLQRIILWQLAEAEQARPGHPVSTAALHGRVVAHIDVSIEELQRVLAQMVGHRVK